MRTAIIADIHGNVPGFEVVFADIEQQNCDRILCLGDVMDGGGDVTDHTADESAVRMIYQREIPTVRGNHDGVLAQKMAPELIEWIEQLPDEIVEGDVVYTHISPGPKKRKTMTPYGAWSVLDETPHRLVFVGHIHVSVIFRYRNDDEAMAASICPFKFNHPFRLDPNERYLISPGAIGYPRDGIGKIRYAIYDDEKETVDIRALDGPLLKVGYWWL